MIRHARSSQTTNEEMKIRDPFFEYFEEEEKRN
jgi:hypothetical protein